VSNVEDWVLCRKENGSTTNEVEDVVHVLEGFAHDIYSKLGARMHRLAVAGWEIRVRLKELQAANGAWRVVVSNPTGHTCTVQVRIFASHSFLWIVTFRNVSAENNTRLDSKF